MGTKESISHYHETLSEALQGVELEFSGLDIEFKGTGNKFNFLLLTDSSCVHAMSYLRQLDCCLLTIETQAISSEICCG
jgi:hypothetical protein